MFFVVVVVVVFVSFAFFLNSGPSRVCGICVKVRNDMFSLVFQFVSVVFHKFII